MDRPLLVLVLSFVALSVSTRLGAAIGSRRTVDEAARQAYGIIEAATLTLLGLIIGFTFSMAVGRYDQRKNYEEAEANAIGTESVRAGLLPAADAAAVRALIRDYLDRRILFYQTRDARELRKIDAETAQIQAEMWAVVEAAGTASPTPISALVLAGMNDVLNSQGYTEAAWRNRIPIAAWGLMAVVAVCSNLLVGFGAGKLRSSAPLLLVLPLVLSVAFFLIADIDSPRYGLIPVKPENLASLAESLRASAGKGQQ